MIVGEKIKFPQFLLNLLFILFEMMLINILGKIKDFASDLVL